jgi:hypothetical protein
VAIQWLFLWNKREIEFKENIRTNNHFILYNEIRKKREKKTKHTQIKKKPNTKTKKS